MIKKPKQSQLLIFPMNAATISAGYKNKVYSQQPAHRFTHYGVDYCTLGNDDFDVVGQGNGEVIGVEFNAHNSLGGIVVVKYDDVFIPTLNCVTSLILRYYHMATLYIKK